MMVMTSHVEQTPGDGINTGNRHNARGVYEFFKRLIIQMRAAGTGSALDEAAWVWSCSRRLVFEVSHQAPVPPRLGQDTASMSCRQGLAAMLCRSNRPQTKGDLGRCDGVSVQL